MAIHDEPAASSVEAIEELSDSGYADVHRSAAERPERFCAPWRGVLDGWGEHDAKSWTWVPSAGCLASPPSLPGEPTCNTFSRRSRGKLVSIALGRLIHTGFAPDMLVLVCRAPRWRNRQTQRTYRLSTSGVICCVNVVKLGERLTGKADANAEPSPVTGRCRD